MRAVIARFPHAASASAGVLELDDVPVPDVFPGDVRIRVHAAGVNPVDLLVASGTLAAAGLVDARERHGLGVDVAGTVDAVGDGVTAFAPGDRVIAFQDRLGLPTGAQADFVVLHEDAVAPLPAHLTFAQGATLPLNALTADQALDLLGLAPGRTLLVTGAAGAVGGYAVELGAARGLRVIGVAAPSDEADVRAFGASEFLPRGDELGVRVRRLVPGGVDGVLDAAMVGSAALDATRGGGAFVAVNAGAAPVPLRGIRVEELWVRADGKRLQALAQQVTPRIAETLSLDDVAKVAKAHELLAAGGLRGRIVLSLLDAGDHALGE